MSLHDRAETTSQAAAPPAAGRRLGLALLVIATAQLVLVLDDTIVNIALPSMQRSLHIATPHLNWVASFYALAFPTCPSWPASWPPAGSCHGCSARCPPGPSSRPG
jgi:hypothetical protein